MGWKFPNFHRWEGMTFLIFNQISRTYLKFSQLGNILKFNKSHTKIIFHNCTTFKLKPAFNTSYI